MQKRFRTLTVVVLGLLMLQFVLAMILNLFVKLSDTHPGYTGSYEYFSRSGHSYIWAITNGGGIALWLHALVGTGLLIGSVALLVCAIVAHHKRMIWVSSLGLLGIFGAFGNGLSFLDYNHEFSSFIMAIGFLVAFSSYAIGLTLKIDEPKK